MEKKSNSIKNLPIKTRLAPPKLELNNDINKEKNIYRGFS